MERALLDDLFAVRPQAAIQRALADSSTDPDSYGFLRAKAVALDPGTIIKALAARPPEGVDRHDETLVACLSDTFASETWDRHGYFMLEAFDHAGSMDRAAWLDLTRRLQGRLPSWVWFRFVDEVRGGKIFNALNVGRPVKYPGFVLPENMLRGFCENDEKDRPEPLVLPLLDNPDNDLAALPYALSLPLNVVLYLHERLPDVVTLDAVKSVVGGKVVEAERWHLPLPEWLAPDALMRLHHCDDAEAKEIFDWLLTIPHEPSVMLDAAFLRFRRNILEPRWHEYVGASLNTGKAWKQGRVAREIVEFCAEANVGFPPLMISAAQKHAKDDESRESIVRGLHDVTASVLVDHAERAIKVGDWKKASRVLEALLCLDPGSFISGPVQHLGKIVEQVPEDVARRIEMCARIFKRSGGRSPTLDGHRDAFVELRGDGR
jgi:hypothetical protein